jgi:hypothetical protein
METPRKKHNRTSTIGLFDTEFSAADTASSNHEITSKPGKPYSDHLFSLDGSIMEGSMLAKHIPPTL